MIRQFILKIRSKIPHHDELFQSRMTRPLAPYFNKPCYWTKSRRKIALSIAIGLFCGLMPGPTQVLSALLVAYFLRTHLAVAVFTTFYTNPLTYIPLYLTGYEIGSLVLGEKAIITWRFWHYSLSESYDLIIQMGKPLLIGVPILAFTLAVLGYILAMCLGRIYITRKWKRRHLHK